MGRRNHRLVRASLDAPLPRLQLRRGCRGRRRAARRRSPGDGAMNEAGQAKDSAQPRRRAIGRARRGLAMALVTLALPASARAQTSPAPTPLPRVHVLASGGTISNTEGERLTGEQLVRAIPRLGEIARVTVGQFSNVASGAFTVDMWRRLASRIRALAAGPDAPRGLVVTHGPDTMAETAYRPEGRR